jgi:hypothetical protein
MKYFSLRRARLIALVCTLGCASLVVAGVWRSSAFKESDKTEARRQFHVRLRDGVGREVRLPAPGDSIGQVRAATASVANFIARRSGVKLGGAMTERLAALEEKAAGGHLRRLTIGELSEVVNVTVLERLATLSDQDIARADDTLRGFNAGDFPGNIDRDFKLPGGTVFIGTPPEKTIGRMKSVRDQLGTPAGEVFAGMARRIVRERVQNLARHLSEALPEQFGNTWDVSNDRENRSAAGGITPLQSVLIVYSLASDDYLSDGQDSLGARMRVHQRSLTKLSGRPYPAPDGHHAYGANGYIFSSPLDLMLDDQTLNRLLDRIEGKGGTR